ncbi:MAG: CHRD domain-containing protein [Acidobacteria bacterium]|nr:MAG: CHRD domain-containing protein [Acidobacteriota bacterium]
MRPIVSLVGACVLILCVSACQSPIAPPTSITLTAALSPANEIPPVITPDAAGRGTVTILMNVSRDDAGNVTAATATVTCDLTGFPPGTTLTGAHVHIGGINSSGSIVLDTGLGAGEVVLTTGSGSFSKQGIGVDPTVAGNMVSMPASYYFNIHTALTPGGAARGQLIRQ